MATLVNSVGTSNNMAQESVPTAQMPIVVLVGHDKEPDKFNELNFLNF